jgi:hypothetical protein
MNPLPPQHPASFGWSWTRHPSTHHPSIRPPIHPSIHPPSIHPSICPPIHPSSTHPSIHPSIHPPIHLGLAGGTHPSPAAGSDAQSLGRTMHSRARLPSASQSRGLPGPLPAAWQAMGSRKFRRVRRCHLDPMRQQRLPRELPSAPGSRR